MTTYSYALVLSDDEANMLEAALKVMIQFCERDLAGGPPAPTTEGLCCTWLVDGAQQMRKRLHLLTSVYREEGPIHPISHTFELGDDAMMVVKEALEVMIQHGESALADEPNTPLRAWRHCASAVRDRLFDNTQLMSCTTFEGDE